MGVAARRDFWATMRGEAARGRTVVYATHYLEEADDFADRIVLMAGGRVIADGPTEEIRARATGRLVSAAVGDVDRARRRLSELGAVEACGARVSVRSANADARLLLTELDARDLEVTAGSLEDAFVALTGSPDARSTTAVRVGAQEQR